MFQAWTGIKFSTCLISTFIAFFLMVLSPDALADQNDLKIAYQNTVEQKLDPPAEEILRYRRLATEMLEQSGVELLIAQYAVIVDRSPQVQALFIFWFPLGEPAVLIGASPVSTGQLGRVDHFETPTGVFDHSLTNPDFRAEGTKNKLGFRGYGAKGLRVYDMGWQRAKRGWGVGGKSLMRLQMHSTDPVLAEPLLGSVQSEGCIRIPASLNRLIDHFGVLDANYEAARATGQHLWMLNPDQMPITGAGRYLIVVDSLQNSRPDWLTKPLAKSIEKKRLSN